MQEKVIERHKMKENDVVRRRFSIDLSYSCSLSATVAKIFDDGGIKWDFVINLAGETKYSQTDEVIFTTVLQSCIHTLCLCKSLNRIRTISNKNTSDSNFRFTKKISLMSLSLVLNHMLAELATTLHCSDTEMPSLIYDWEEEGR